MQKYLTHAHTNGRSLKFGLFFTPSQVGRLPARVWFGEYVPMLGAREGIVTHVGGAVTVKVGGDAKRIAGEAAVRGVALDPWIPLWLRVCLGSLPVRGVIM